MSRWIVFDQPSADAVQTFAGVRPEIRTDAGHPGVLLAMALNSRSAAAVLPAAATGNRLLLRIRHPQATPAPAKTPSNLAPAGFLGLSDAIDMDSEPEQPRKWWQKLIG